MAGICGRIGGGMNTAFTTTVPLAEGLRVQMYWGAAGITASAADYYLRRQRSEFEWIRQALRAWTLTAKYQVPRLRLPMPPGGRALTGFANNGWTTNGTITANRARRQSMGTWLNRVGMGFFVLGLLLAGAKPLFRGNVALTVAIGLAPAVAALLYIYARTRAFLEQARQYDRMSRLFGVPGAALRQASRKAMGSISAPAPGARQGGFARDGDWVLLHRERPITFGSARSWVLAGSWLLGVCSRGGVRENQANNAP